MRKYLLTQFLLCLFAIPLLAQNRTITGKITSSEDGSVLPGVTVLLKGTNQGTTTNSDGTYQISANKGDVLQVSFIGFATTSIKIENQSTVDVALKPDASQLQEVVVTAQGVRKSQRELGYAVSKVATEDVTVGRSPQLAQALSGKVTGLAVYNINNSVDPAVKVVLRGYRSLTGNNEALVVLDGMQTTSTVLALINPNDIESVTILKGGQAATLYGSAGINGAILITTKKGVKGKLKVAYSNSTNFDQISFLPALQDKYGSGSHYATSFGGAGYKTDYLERMKDNWRPYENQQYGDAFDGSTRIQGRTAEDGSQLIIPYSAIPDARRKAFNTGVSVNNQVNFSGGDETSSFYMSIENQSIAGIVPNDKSNRTGTRLSATKEYGKVTASFNAAYTQANYDRTSSDFYNDVLNQPANLPLADLRNWQTNPLANPNGFYNDYYNNPYFNADNQRMKYKDANLNGNLNINFKPTPWLSFNERLGVMNNSRTGKNTTGKFLYSDWAKTKSFIPAPYYHDGDGTGIYRAITDILGSVLDYSGTENVINNEFQINLTKDFGPVTTKLLLGNSVYQRTTKNIAIGSSSIVVPNVYNVANRQGELTGGEILTQERRIGYYADLTANYKNWLILNGSFRFDQTSKFFKPSRPSNYYSYPYYGAALSFIATDAFPNIRSSFLNYAKFRANYNKNANDNIPLYGLDLTYPNGSGFPYGNTVGLTVGNTLPDANLKPEIVYSSEIGAEFQLLNNRINIDVSAYTQTSQGQVITVRIPNSTGFQNLLINVGETKNWGYEAELKYLIARGNKFSWDASVRYSYNDNKVVDLYPGVNEFQYGGFSYANTNVIKDLRFPYLKTDGYQYAPDGSGRVLVNATTGYPLRNTQLQGRGGVLPRHIAGLGSKIEYGDFGFTFNFEYRGGNVMFSDLGRQMTFTGTGKWTEDRAPHIFPNSAYLGPDGTTVVPNTTLNVREAEYSLWVDNYRLISENFVTPAWFIKLRDINLSYRLPQNLINKTKIFSGASIALYGRNLLTIVDKLNYYTDPEFSYQGNPTPGSQATSTPTVTSAIGTGINTTTQTPPVRQYGVNINLSF
ncbi:MULTISPECIES: SusC/RagA family TonB-linked outer membrane protein [unclassified Spirosoma]|uniref:SusC/RagA family TonB-linked outer membrane protein n=1 Tax=unclassified Spirosoma TaxID=2621999 RepID=UPI000961A5C2|nr:MULTISPECIES: SusC/RagA family TonB-linked outer membrane protein [unclassified Spirosoma]MBN8823604.1 SusC/RagA family TonB-linked outer membrane protein [Spirosoma sp.]OJW76836.1 MAG: SusC/RagA family TonB-linked outer membrane protein [Spirosoma sp. 48-14]